MTRDVVPVLGGVSYCVYTAACSALANDWLTGKVGDGAPSEEAEIEILQTAINSSNQHSDVQREEFQHIYDLLVEKRVPNILRIATSHRRWVRQTFTFLSLVGMKPSGDMEHQVRMHDLSKYSPKEILGYAIMFGEGQDTFKNLSGDEKTEWTMALQHHFSSNSHHPEFYGRGTDGGPRDVTAAMIDTPNGRLYLEESLIDMLAARGERQLTADPVISVKKWMDMPGVFLNKYSDRDRVIIKALYTDLLEKASVFVQNPDNAHFLKGMFDNRPVVA